MAVFVCVPATGIHFCGSLEMIIYSRSVYVCVCVKQNERVQETEEKIRLRAGGAGRRGAWKGPLPPWIPGSPHRLCQL